MIKKQKQLKRVKNKIKKQKRMLNEIKNFVHLYQNYIQKNPGYPDFFNLMTILTF